MNLLAIVFGFLFLLFSILFWINKVPKKLIDFEKIEVEDTEGYHFTAIRRAISLLLLAASVIFLMQGFAYTFFQHYFLVTTIVFFLAIVLLIVAIEKTSWFKRK